MKPPLKKILYIAIYTMVLGSVVGTYFLERYETKKLLNKAFYDGALSGAVPIASYNGINVHTSTSYEKGILELHIPTTHENDYESYEPVTDNIAAEIWRQSIQELKKEKYNHIPKSKYCFNLEDISSKFQREQKRIKLNTPFVITLRDSLNQTIANYPDTTINLQSPILLKPMRVPFWNDINVILEYEYPLSYFLKKHYLALIFISITTILCLTALTLFYRLEKTHSEKSKVYRDKAFDFSKNIHTPIHIIKQILKSADKMSNTDLSAYSLKISDEFDQMRDTIEETMLNIICGERIFAKKQRANIAELIDIAVKKEVKAPNSHIYVVQKIEPSNLTFDLDVYHVTNAIRYIIKHAMMYGKKSKASLEQINCHVENHATLCIEITVKSATIIDININDTNLDSESNLRIHYTTTVARAHNGSIKAIDRGSNIYTFIIKLR